MDNLTHAALAAAIAEAAFRRKLGWKALVAAPVLASLPDADIVSAWLGPWEVLKYHRGPTHSLIVLAVVAPLFGWALWRIAHAKKGTVPQQQRGQSPFLLWTLLAFAALASNPALDWFTSFGTQLLWPITNHRFAIDAVAIIDPWYTGPLLLAALLLPFTSRERVRAFSRWFAVGALALSTAYLAFGLAQMFYAQTLAARQLSREGFRVARLRAVPTIGANLLWRVMAGDDAGNLRVGYVSTLAPRSIRFSAIARVDNPLVEKALASDRGRLFAWFADGWVSARIQTEGGETRILLEDQRYGPVIEPDRSFFTATAVFNAKGELLGVERIFGARLDRRRELEAAWRLMLGRDGE